MDKPFVAKYGAWAMVFVLPFLMVACEKKPDQGATTSIAAIGRPAPDFLLKDTKSRSWKLSDLKGKVVFVNFWATWCKPCRDEMPAMEELNKDLDKERFQMLAVLSGDQPEMGERFIRMIGGTFPVLPDDTGAVSKLYGITGVPETFIVDADGVVREKFIGPRPWNSREAKEMLKFYLR